MFRRLPTKEDHYETHSHVSDMAVSLFLQTQLLSLVHDSQYSLPAFILNWCIPPLY